MVKLLNHIAQVLRWIAKTYFLKYRRGFSRILLRSLEAIYQASGRLRTKSHHFHSSSTKRFSCNGLSTGPFAEALHEQDTVNLKESILYSGQEKVAFEGATDAMQELQAAENRQFWITASEETSEKCPNYKGTLEASKPR